ncbi:RICIN domain-containing protein [Streptomyces sp. NBC_00727]|uniref:RICIN domain-containing protein n=1 Tax=Streptomyces sp. NBC_00727 TaxID=2903675 RepID=UPI003867C4B4
MRVKRIAQAVGAVTLAPLLVLATSGFAHADDEVHWTHRTDNKCLEVHYSWATTTPDDVEIKGCTFTDFTFWYDAQQSDGSWLEKDNAKCNYCMTAYTDHDVYMEACSGNNYQRRDEINRGNGYQLKNRQTHECLDSNGTSVYVHACNDGDYQRWY